MCGLTDAETERVDGFETGSVMFKLNAIKNILNFLSAEYDWQFLLFFGPDKFEICPVPFQGQHVEKLDAAERNSTCGSGPFSYIFVIEEILTEFFIINIFWCFLIMFCKLPYSSGLHFYGGIGNVFEV